MLLTEADVTGRYGASHLSVDDADDEGPDEATDENEDTDYDDNPYLFELVFADTYGLSETISGTLPLATPWRTAVVGDLASVTESNLVLALDDSSNVEATSWIESGRVAWSWWSDSGSPQNLDIQKQYIGYASQQGWEYSLVDRGWDRDWMPELVEYADERGVDIIAWLPWYYVNDETRSGAVAAERLGRQRDQGRLHERLFPAVHGVLRRDTRSHGKLRIDNQFPRFDPPEGPSTPVAPSDDQRGRTGRGVLHVRRAHPDAQRDPSVHAQRRRTVGLHASHVFRRRP